MAAFSLEWLFAQIEGGGQVDSSTIALVVLLIGTLGGGAGLTALLLARKQGRQVDATTTKIEADAAQTLTEANEAFARMARDSQQDIERALSEMRDEVREKRAQAAEALALAASADADLARLRADESQKRHALVNEHAAEIVKWETRKGEWERQIEDLRAQVQSQREQLEGLTQRRRRGDEPRTA